MPPINLTICVTCQRATTPAGAEHLGRHMYRAVESALATRQSNAQIRLREVECMSVCTRACTVAVSSPGKWTYIIGDLDAGRDMDDLFSYLESYASNPHGTPPLKDRPTAIRRGTVARLPPTM